MPQQDQHHDHHHHHHASPPHHASEPHRQPHNPSSSWFQFEAQLPPQTHLPLDRISYYDTPRHTYLIATNSEFKDYRLLKFTKDDEGLDVHMVSTIHERHEMVNVVRALKAGSPDTVQSGKARGILGFVRFTKGYYLILITKRREVAKIGTHRIFEARGTTMISLCEPQKNQFLRRRSDEDYYRDLFLKFELDDYFYYSPTYDLTNTLQANMTHRDPGSSGEAASALGGDQQPPPAAGTKPPLFGSLPRRNKFVWNEFLLEPTCVSGPRPQQPPGGGSSTATPAMSAEYTCSIAKGIHVADAWLPWISFAVRGCVAQCRLETTASPITVILIGRTSKNFAGTRYLRRGINEDGHVANHVEVEQIVFVDSSLTQCGTRGRFSSYVQVRGSVPVHWFHGMVQRPKPPILLGKVDPFYNSTRLHLEEILRDFGPPVVLMNLLKTTEKKRREGILTNEYVRAFSVLTTHMEGPRDALPVRYHSFDLRNAADRAWNSMTAFGEREGDEIGIFACDHDSVRLQSGVVRSNCVDCIDRTNLAQYFFGLHALGKQLTALGLLHHEVDVAVSQQSAYDAMLRLYLRLGDAIAIQYGGSAQVGAGILHRGLGWDKLMGIRRLYNNLVVDKDRQQVMNLFLGLYEPCPNSLRLLNRLTLPLHRKALALNASAAAAVATANQNQSGTATPLDEDAPAYWDVASTVVDDATAFAMRRVVDIQELEADYYLHCATGPVIGTGAHLKDWWVTPLGEFARRYEHVRACHQEHHRQSRYSRQRSRGAVSPSSGSQHRHHRHSDVGSLSSSQQSSSRASSLRNSGQVDEATAPYFMLNSQGNVVYCTSDAEWRHQAMCCWLKDRSGRSAESDEEAEESVLADMSPQPVIKATNLQTTLAHDGMPENAQLYEGTLAFDACAAMQHGPHHCWTTVGGDGTTPIGSGMLNEPIGSACRPPTALRESIHAPSWQLSRRLERFPHSPMFVVGDPEAVTYWDQGPDYGRSCEMVHNHASFPDEVNHSLHRREIDELRRVCDKQPNVDTVRRSKITCLLRFGDPMLWSVDDLCDALELVEPTVVLPGTIKYLREEQMSGEKLLRWVHFDQFRQTALLREFTMLLRMIPTLDYRAVEQYLHGPSEPDWASVLVVDDDRDPDALPHSWATAGGEGPDAPLPPGGLAHAVSTTQFLQHYTCVTLNPITADRFIRHVVAVMASPPEDPNDRRQLGGGVPRQDRLRYHHDGQPRTPNVSVLHQAFWTSTLLAWLLANSQRVGMNLHQDIHADDARIRAGEFIVWLLHAGLVVPAEHLVTHDTNVGVDVSFLVIKDVLADRNMALFTFPALQPRTVLNVVEAGHALRTPPPHSPRALAIRRNDTTTFLRVPMTPRLSGGTRAGDSERESHHSSGGMRSHTGEYISASSIGGAPPSTTIRAAADVAAKDPLQFSACCANLAFAALSLLDDQHQHTPSSSHFTGVEGTFSHVTELEFIDLSLLNSEERMCFFVNIFNTLYIHAWMVALQKQAVDVRRFYHVYAYNIGGMLFTLHDIKHGILRRNRPAATEVLAPFAPGDRRMSLIPGDHCRGGDSQHLLATREGRAKLLLALMDAYLTPDRLAEVMPYNPKQFVDDCGSSVANSSMAHPILYEDGFELVAEADDSSDEDVVEGGTPSVGKVVAGVGGGAVVAATSGAAFFANLFRRDRGRVGSIVPQHFCIALVPQMYVEQLNSIEVSFTTAVNDPSQPQTALNQSAPYPRLLQALIGLEDIGRTPEEVSKLFIKKKRRAAGPTIHLNPALVHAAHHSNSGSNALANATSAALRSRGLR